MTHSGTFARRRRAARWAALLLPVLLLAAACDGAAPADSEGADPSPEAAPLGSVPTVGTGQTGGPQDRGIPAFPGAEGFGAGTPGGRGGRVIPVTTLDDSGPGSLREALEAAGPRIIVFRTAGTITLKDQIRITNPYVTVAGQTAPGDGITLRASPWQYRGLVVIDTHDVVIRYLRFRQGAHREIDAAIPLSATAASDVVIDHNSLSWATDEVLTTYDDTQRITVSWNIISEGLSNSTHYEGEHSRGLFVSGEDSADISVHHNLLAHNMQRNPEVNTAGTSDIRNNVAYDWGTHAIMVSDKNGEHGTNIVGNFFKPGPSTTDADRREIDVYPVGPGMRLYVEGNIGPHRDDPDQPDRDSVDSDGHAWLVDQPIPAASVTTTSAQQAYRDVLAGAGARVPRLDQVDRRILRDVLNGTGRIIDDPEEVGGWPELDAGEPPTDTDADGMPDAWEGPRGLDPLVDDSAADRDGDRYTNIEEYVNSLALG